MECGSQELFCQVLKWVTENETGASGIAELVGRFGEHASGWSGVVARVLKDYGQAIVGALGLSFGFWRWWRFREQILHKRLSEYIANRDGRLKNAREQVLETIQRPGPGVALAAPLFINAELRSVLQERNWDSTFLAATVENSADLQLSGAIGSIKKRLHTAEAEAGCLRQELSTAYCIKGAIAATRSNRLQNTDWNSKALGYFRSALDLPGHEGDVTLIELEAHQHRKLGHLDAARTAYEKAFNLAATVQEPRLRNLLAARARRYLAELKSQQAPFIAYCIMTAGLDGPNSPGAIELMKLCRPLENWELVELGDMHFLTAYLASQHPHFVWAPSLQLDLAIETYEKALDHRRTLPWIRRRRAHDRATEGLQRAKEAQNNGNYDIEWLDLPVQQAQQVAPDVGAAGRD